MKRPPVYSGARRPRSGGRLIRSGIAGTGVAPSRPREKIAAAARRRVAARRPGPSAEGGAEAPAPAAPAPPPAPDLATLARTLFGPLNGVELDLYGGRGELPPREAASW